MNHIDNIMALADEYAQSGGWLERDYLRAAIEQALTPGEALRIAGLTLIGLAEHDQHCEVFDLDGEGRHRACTCGFGDAIAAITHAGKSAAPQPQREWSGLTDGEIQAIEDNTLEGGSFWDVYRAIEAKLKEKNRNE